MAEKTTIPTEKSRTLDKIGAKKTAAKKTEEKKLISFVDADAKIEEIKNPIIEAAQSLASANIDSDDSSDEMGDDDISEEIQLKRLINAQPSEMFEVYEV